MDKAARQAMLVEDEYVFEVIVIKVRRGEEVGLSDR